MDVQGILNLDDKGITYIQKLYLKSQKLFVKLVVDLVV